jgi:RNA polymerase sigma-70 factor (ECF subfamily)
LLRELLVARPSDEDTRSTPTETADWADVRATLAGEGDAYERLIRNHQETIAAYMWRFTRDRREWEELIQDVFVEAFLSLNTYAGRAPLLHWLKRVATRVGYRFWKTRRGRREFPLPTDADVTLATSDSAEAVQHAAELVHWLLARLGPRDRLVMTLAYLEECSVQQTAELTGWSQSMVKVQTHRARRRLAKICREMGVEL